MRLSPKLLLLVGIITVAGFGTLVTMLVDSETRNLTAAHKSRNKAVAHSVASGIQNIMLTNRADVAAEYVNDSRKWSEIEGLRIFNKDGVEVFLPHQRRIGDTNTHARHALSSGQAITSTNQLVRPLANKQECHRCHESNATWRGALAVQLNTENPDNVVFGFVLTALKNVMLTGNAELVDGFLETIESHDSIERVTITGTEAEPVYGNLDDFSEPVAKAATQLLKTGGLARAGQTFLAAVKNETQCHKCHGDEEKFRGLVSVTMAPIPKEKLLTVASALFEKSLTQLMVTNRGNELDGYLHQLRLIPEISVAGLFDEQGTEVYPPTEQSKPIGEKTTDPDVLEALATGQSAEIEVGDRLTQLRPLPNEIRCQACHKSDHTVRGVVQVDADLAPMRNAIKANVKRASFLVVLFVLIASLVLFVFIRRVLVNPVLEIGEVAQTVGGGNLDVLVDHHSKDEVGDLASRVNEMILGLRSKGMMERFVGDHTRRMIDESIRGSADHKAPVRRRVAVLFSDVRGFTSYAERREPEQVIKTLNLYLGVQAEVVKLQGGYVDKFVGDEIMAIFEGDDMETRAVQAAQEMMAAVRNVESDDKMEIGIGIAAGDVVFGSMGATGRQDYTVIGDVVNLAARLCSAAGAGLVVVSNEIQIHTSEVVAYGPAKELTVKGKSKPVVIYEVS